MINARIRSLLTIIFICAPFLFASLAGAQDDGGRRQAQDERVRPPSALKCDRNHLTSYTGRVTSYRRSAGRLSMTIRTDWDTTETVTLRYARRGDPARWFLYKGETFRRGDWRRIESSNNRLRRGVRATAWVCDDGSNPVIDWQPPVE